MKPSEVTLEIPIDGGLASRLAEGLRDRCTLTVLAGPASGQLVTAEDRSITLGRGEESTVRIDDAGMSRLHARISKQADGYVIEDLDSKNGTFISGQQVRGRRQLKEGERILMGEATVVKFSIHDAFEQEAARRLYESAVRDPLTHLYNRRYLDDRLEGEFAFALRHGSPLSILLLDIDLFKNINDTYGHQAGDEVIRRVAAVLGRAVRTEDLIARYGGEEFLVVARGTQEDAAAVVAERIRRLVQKTHVQWEQDSVEVTVSVGLATRTLERPYSEVKALVAAADEALYRAKASGRNKVCQARHSKVPPR